MEPLAQMVLAVQQVERMEVAGANGSGSDSGGGGFQASAGGQPGGGGGGYNPGGTGGAGELVITYTGGASTPITAIGSTTGTPQVGVLLTAGSLNPGGATASYQWQEATSSGGTYTNISGATSSTYTPVGGDFNQYIEVVATGTGSYTGTVTSAPVDPVAAAATATTYTLTEPTSGTVNVASTNFTGHPNGLYTGTITPHSTGSGTFSPTSLTWSNTSTAQTFTYTPTSTTGSPHAISTTNSTSLTNPSSISYTVNAATAGYQYYVPITVTSNTSIASGTQSNFPMLVSSTFSQWKSVGNGGHVQNIVTAPNGGQEPADLIYSLSSSCSSPLNFETESYAPTTGALVDWINVPTMQAGQVMYVCYDNSLVTTDQSHPSTTWNSNYVGVWHLPNGTSLTTNDSTGMNNGINSGATAIAGQIDGGGYFTQVPEIDLGNNSSLNLTSNWTYSAWVKRGALNGLQPIFSHWQSNSAGRQIFIYFSTTPDNTVQVDIPWIAAIVNSGTTITDTTTFHHVVVTKNGSTWSIYFDGSLVNSATNSSSQESGTNDVFLGYDSVDPDNLNGTIDEARISNSARSANWVKTEYNNQSAPGTFYTMGSESAPLTALTPSTLPNATTSVVYLQLLTESGGGAPYTWSVASGTLPSGLSLATSSTNNTTTISGTPTSAGTANFTIQVQSSDGSTSTQAYALTVISGTHLISGTVLYYDGGPLSRPQTQISQCPS